MRLYSGTGNALSNIAHQNFLMDGTNRDEIGPKLNAEVEAYIDAANRLETSMDRQLSIINGIDDKAEHVTRLVAILLGLIFTIVSLAFRTGQITATTYSTPLTLSFMLGIFFLLLTMAFAIITYLSSTYRIGLHPNVGTYLSNSTITISYSQHIQRVLGSYGTMIQQNRAVIETNSNRFRLTLTFLLTGTIYLSTTGTIYVGSFGFGWQLMSLLIGTLFAMVAGWYILTGQYLILERVGGIHV